MANRTPPAAAPPSAPSPDSLLAPLLAPASVALVGASANPTKNTARPLRYLRAHGYEGRIYPVHPRAEVVQGAPAWPSVAALPEAVDHALIMVPALAVPEAVDQCGARGVRVASVYSDGFAEAGPAGVARQRALMSAARAAGVRVLGPNSMGVVSVPARLALTVNAALDTPRLIPGDMSVVSQSGTMIGALLSRAQARGMGFARLISVGNEADVAVAELVNVLVIDPETAVIVLFLECIRDPVGLAAAARRAHAAGKPVIAYKLGASDSVRELAKTHSGAISGSDVAVSAYFADHGILRVQVLETLFELPSLVRGRTARAGGRRVAVVSTTGGGAATVVDRLGAHGIDAAGVPPGVAEALVQVGLTPGTSPVIDLTMAGTRAGAYARVLGALLAAANEPACPFDAVVAVVGSSAQFHPEVAVRAIVEAPASRLPVAAFPVPEAGDALDALAAAGVAAFRTPESCAEALRAWLDWRAPRAVPAVMAPPAAACAAVMGGRPAGGLDEVRSGELCDLLGIPRPRTWTVRPGDPLPRPAGPVAVKVISAHVAHKTEAGGVVLDVRGAEALARAVAQVLANVARSRPDAAIEGVAIQEMAPPGHDVLLAYRRDPEAGPVITLGVGGVLAELHGDVTVRPAPVSPGEAAEMVAAVRGLAPVLGYRGLPPGDGEALARAASRLSSLALLTDSRIGEVELNPLRVLAPGQGVCALDALVILC